ncbi:UvrB/UvrC motif-containing protein [Akkermansiaceae bacterium]|nr:UvrB/UvrC motif-containing protein [Akkermansiaceae bacterium]
MKCQFCNKQATIHFKQVIAEGTKQVHLCETCAANKGFSDLSAFSLDDLFLKNKIHPPTLIDDFEKYTSSDVEDEDMEEFDGYENFEDEFEDDDELTDEEELEHLEQTSANMGLEGFSEFLQFNQALDASEESKRERTNDLVCKSCEFTLEDFKKVGRMGCPDCYSAFSKDVYSLLPKMHVGSQHKGKKPIAMLEVLKLQSDLSDSQKELELAIKAEDFEKAASLRDIIKTLNGGGELKEIDAICDIIKKSS